MVALPPSVPADWAVVWQPVGPHTVMWALVIGAICPLGSVQVILAASAAVVTLVGELGFGANGGVLSTVTCCVVAAAKFGPASMTPTLTVWVPSPIWRESNENDSGPVTLEHGERRV